MSDETKLLFPASIDLAGLGRDIARAEAMVDGLASTSAGKLSGLKAGGTSLDLGSSAPDEIMGAFLPLGSKIQSALGSAVGPLNHFAADFMAKFNEVGATVERLSIRIDDAMRFPGFLRRFDAFHAGLKRAFLIPVRQLGQDLKEGVAVATARADAMALVGPFKKASEKIRLEFKAIPDGFGYAVEQATHVDAKGAFSGFMKGLDGVRSAAIDKMRQMQEDLAGAKGKGSRKKKWAARDLGAEIQSTVASAPARQATTPGFTPPINTLDRYIYTLKGMGKVALEVAQLHGGAAKTIIQTAGLIPSGIAGAYRGFANLRSVVSTFGSVANATFPTAGKLAQKASAAVKFDPAQSTILKGMGSAARSAGSGFKSMADQVSLAFGFTGIIFKAASVFKDFVGQGIKGGTNLAETYNKVDVVLGASGGKVKTFADDLANRFGLVKGTVLDASAGFAGLAKSTGRLEGDQLADFSTKFTKLSAGLSSFQNISLEDASQALTSALAGNQSDVLRKLGADFDADQVKAYAFAHGIARTGEELTKQQEFAARSQMIFGQLGHVYDDLERTQGGAANQGRKLWGSLQNIATSIGSAVLPVVTEGITLFNEFASKVASGFESNKATIEGWTNTLLDGFDYVIATVHNFPAAFEVARIKVAEFVTNVEEWFGVLGPNIVMVADYIGRNWLLLIGDAFDATVTALKNLYTNFANFGKAAWEALKGNGFEFNWTPILDGFRATAEQFPAIIKPVLTDMSRQIADASKPITDEVARRRAERMAKPAGANIAQAAPLDDASKAKKDKKDDRPTQALGGALELGSKEAYSAIVQATATRTGPMDQVAKAGNETARNTALLVEQNAGNRRDRTRRPERRGLVIS